jgi:hypothetical protein
MVLFHARASANRDPLLNRDLEVDANAALRNLTDAAWGRLDVLLQALPASVQNLEVVEMPVKGRR